MGVWNEFEELNEYYPGSKQKRALFQQQASKPSTLEDQVGKPRVYTVGGKDVDFFTVGQLAMALNRKAVTIRKWETDGVIPVTPYNAPSDDPRGRRRLYTREMVEGMAYIAEEEGILADTWKPITKTQFPRRVRELFERLFDEGV